MVALHHILGEPLVDKNLKRDLGHFAALDPSDCSRCKIAGIRKRNFQARIQCGKVRLGKVDFSSDSQIRFGRKSERYGCYGLDVGRHIIAHHAVAPCHRPDKQSILIVEYNRNSVDFFLDDNPHILADFRLGLLNPGEQLPITVRLIQAEHRNGMRNFAEGRVEVASHPLGRRVGTL